MNIKIIVIHIGLIALWSCKPPQKAEIKPLKSITQSVIILNEGRFGSADADFSLYDPDSLHRHDSLKIQNNIFFRKHHEYLGDILQSLHIHNERYYWVINNSEKIIITDSAFNKLDVITGLTAPRRMYFPTQDKAYVSDLYDDRIAVIDLHTNKISKHIKCRDYTNHFIKDLSSQNVWISSQTSEYIYLINTETDFVIDSMKTVYGPNNLVMDINNHLWIGCNGNAGTNVHSALLCVDLDTKTILKTIPGPLEFSISNLTINPEKNTLYWVEDGIKKMGIDQSSYPDQNFIEVNGKIIYGLDIDPNNGDIYACDAIDYVQNGYTYRYNSSGTEIDKFRVGKIPNGVIFR